MSIRKDPVAKIRETLRALKKNKISCRRLSYVTNQLVPDQDSLGEKLYKEFDVVVQCRDIKWLRGNINRSDGTLRTYHAFLGKYQRDITVPGRSLVLEDLEQDPRVYVFLRQQWQAYGHKNRLDDLLAESMVLLALESTDPDNGRLMSRTEILQTLTDRFGAVPATIESRLDDLLTSLSVKGGPLNHHTQEDKYCLSYEARLRIAEHNASDLFLVETFSERVLERLKKLLLRGDDVVAQAHELLLSVLNDLFKKQGLEFATFVLDGDNNSAFEKSLPEIALAKVEDSSVDPALREPVAEAILSCIREVVYKGEPEENEFLRRLSHSYMMLFLLQCDPKVATFFSTMASRLTVFVCNSLIIPAISELPLEPRHRRHWNLLQRAHRAGVTLRVTKVVIAELVAHIRKSVQRYERDYAGAEEFYCQPDTVKFVDEILVRSFFYAKIQGKVETFDAYLEDFVSPDEPDVEEELIEWLHRTFGMEYVTEESLGVDVSDADLETLTTELSSTKASRPAVSHDILEFSARALATSDRWS